MSAFKIDEGKSIFAKAGKEISKRILMVDDNKIIRDTVADFLVSLGYEVAVAVNGIEALDVFLDKSFDLVLTDLEMPAMDGFILAGHIKENSPGTPVIMLTGADRGTVLKMVEPGPVDSIIFKPFMLDDLQASVQRALIFG
ncbi:MAG: response regulator [Desulfobacteraceae bacterium]|jgi:CheY-like chemotaxis protein|nr:response regulator [Desulfobacteraceae bacterium]